MGEVKIIVLAVMYEVIKLTQPINMMAIRINLNLEILALTDSFICLIPIITT